MCSKRAKFSYPAKCLLAKDISEPDWQRLLTCIGAIERGYAAGEIIAGEGVPADKIGILVSGRVVISRDQLDGRRVIIETLLPQASFGAAYVYTGAKTLTVNITATEPSRVILIDSESIPVPCSEAGPCHFQLIRNAFHVISLRNFHFKQRLRIITQRSIKAKLLTYLNIQAKRHGVHEFDIPLNRQELADYLCVDRSTLSVTITQLQREGVLASRRNHFLLYRKA